MAADQHEVMALGGINMPKKFRGKQGRNPKFRGKDRREDTPRRDERDDSRQTFDRRESGPYKGNPFNDFSWYARNPELVRPAANLPFPYKPGMSVALAAKYTASTKQVREFQSAIPGILCLNWMPTLGQSKVASDPASNAAKEIFARVRSAFSGTLKADPPDYVIYLCALDSIFSYIGSLKRIYRILTAYSPFNYNMPNLLLQALGIPNLVVEQLKSEKVLLLQNINYLVDMTKKLHCPAIFPMFNRHYWLNDNVYTDANTPKSQFYAFRQTHYFKFALINTPQGQPAGGLSLVAAPTLTTSSPSQTLFDFGRSLIDALQSSD